MDFLIARKAVILELKSIFISMKVRLSCSYKGIYIAYSSSFIFTLVIGFSVSLIEYILLISKLFELFVIVGDLLIFRWIGYLESFLKVSSKGVQKILHLLEDLSVLEIDISWFCQLFECLNERCISSSEFFCILFHLLKNLSDFMLLLAGDL